MFNRQVNGLDELNRTLLIGGLIATIISSFFLQNGSTARLIVSILAAACLIYAVIRLFAGKPEKRYSENMKFLGAVTRVKEWFVGVFGKRGARPAHKARKNPTWAEIKQYKYFYCPQCTQRLRVPRGKGKLRVTCTHCGNVFEVKS